METNSVAFGIGELIGNALVLIMVLIVLAAPLAIIVWAVRKVRGKGRNAAARTPRAAGAVAPGDVPSSPIEALSDELVESLASKYEVPTADSPVRYESPAGAATHDQSDDRTGG